MSLESSTDPMNHGSTFHFTIPYVLANPINKRVHDGGKDGREKKERSNAIMQKDPEMLLGRVLLVDDNLVNLKLCQRFLTKMGCLSETAENGDAAVTRFKKDSGSFDIILMDKEMPVMDGLEAVQKIRAIEVAENQAPIPIVAITAAAMTGDREECLAAGCNDYLPKPLNRVTLYSV